MNAQNELKEYELVMMEHETQVSNVFNIISLAISTGRN